MTRIALIHALRQSVEPIETAFDTIWPEAERYNLLDDSLSTDLVREGRLSTAMVRRFRSLGNYACETGADAILFTCSAFGPAIQAVARDLAPMPVHKPNTAMIEAAATAGRRVGLLATFAPTLASMVPEFPRECEVVTVCCPAALVALAAGDGNEHDRLVAAASVRLADCDVIALAQFSLARAASAVVTSTGRPVLTTPQCAVEALRRDLSCDSHRPSSTDRPTDAR